VGSDARAADEKAPFVIVDYDSAWPVVFEREKSRIVSIIGPHVLAIEHVGSTAVPGLAAKPIIDILVGIPSLREAAACVVPLASIGFEYVPEYEAEIPDRRYFRKGPPTGRTHHLHMVEHGGAFWERHLLFRDFLRVHPERAREYARLKRDLASRFRGDREAYTNGKKDFVRRVEEDARRWRAVTASRTAI